MAAERIPGIPTLANRVGDVLGVSDWLTVGQDRIDAFAGATGDDQWIHTDPERAARESPYGTTVAHGLLTLSLLPVLAAQAFAVDDVATKLNYGFNRVRFTAPVPAGGRVRAGFRLKAVEPQDGRRHLITVEATVELEGSPRPACVAEMLVVYVE
ncbi:hypothetical protein TSO221_24035 [Azospirillum sp. TSO22-1]|nr:hypothetical protein TSO221_24035 [Azospirillum sp. TSO22-1]